MTLTIISAPHDVDLATGDVNVKWPSCDARSVRDIAEGAQRAMTRSFIDGYRMACPDVSDADLAAAVIRWAAK